MPMLVVQMGHAGRTSGATGAPGEQAYTQAVGAECARLLNANGWSVRLIPADPSVSAYRGDVFVAAHADGSTNPAVRGASVGYQNASGGRLAHAWRDAYVARGFDGPWHPDNYTINLAQYYGVRLALSAGTPRACIIECGTITNAEDRAAMDPTRVALAIGDAIGITFAGETEPEMITEERLKSMAYVSITVGTFGQTGFHSGVRFDDGTFVDLTNDGKALSSVQGSINKDLVTSINCATSAAFEALTGMDV